MKKILCICDAGQVRSVAMAHELSMRGYFACACSEASLINLLQSDDKGFDWDFVINMCESGDHFDLIGRDKWGDPSDYNLQRKCILIVDKLEKEGHF
jgi:hypothetical protein